MLEYFKDRKLRLHPEPVNLRKSFSGLTALSNLEKLFAGDVYLFMNRRRNLLKGLYWDEGGFCIFNKQLERGTFSDLFKDKNELEFREFLLMIHCCKGAYFNLK